MQYCSRTLKMIAAIIFFHYPTFALSANNVVVIPMEADRPRLENIVTVAQNGGDFSEIVSAVRSIGDASKSKPYVIYIAPGVYTTNQTIVLPPYVSLIGSGLGATMINSNFEPPRVRSAHCRRYPC